MAAVNTAQRQKLSEIEANAARHAIPLIALVDRGDGTVTMEYTGARGQVCGMHVFTDGGLFGDCLDYQRHGNVIKTYAQEATPCP